MKHLFLLSLFIPLLTFGQVRQEHLSEKGGLTYEKGSNVPFTGKAYSYFPNGDVQTVMEYKDGMPNGEIISWLKKDVKQAEGYVEKGKRTGTWKLYYESGKLKKQTTYQNNAENGEEIFWFENGNLQKKGSYINGKLNGKYQWYFENGQMEQEGFFVDGKEDGIWKEWFENGKQKMIGHFTNLQKHGNWTWWDEAGKVSKSKNYINGLVSVEKDDLDSYLEKMEFFLVQRNYKEALKHVELAKETITDKTERNSVYMGLAVYHSKCYSSFSHHRQGEEILLDAIGLTKAQSQIILSSHLEKSSEKINEVIKELKKKNEVKFQVSNHIALGLCYNILGDTVNLQEQQQLAMEKSEMQDWIINISLALYRLAGERFYNYAALEEIENMLIKEGPTEKLELDKAQYLIRTERLKEAEAIVDKHLKANGKNLAALLLKADIKMAYGNVEEMKFYENKALAIDPKAFSNTKE